MDENLSVKEIIEKSTNSKSNFKFKTKLQVIDRKKHFTRGGKPYLVLTLRDVTGELKNVKKWIEDDDLDVQLLKFDIGNVLELKGLFDLTYGPNVTNSKILKSNEFNLIDFTKIERIEINPLIDDLFNIILKIRNKNLRFLLENIFSYEDIKSKFINCPSSIKHHHPYQHGNLEHTVGMIKVFSKMVYFYDQKTNLDIDLLYTGIILHDIGKIFEYTIYNGIPKILSEGKLYGHLVLGEHFVSDEIKKIRNFPKDLENKIRHLILSHHGKEEWGALVEPQLPEAEFLHLLDMIDSRFKLNY